jgi:outer membrane protein OmpA-like peptidoglycan-associated protein
MSKRTAAALVVAGGLLAAPAFSQTTAPNPTQRDVAQPRPGTPVFRVTVVGRTVPTVNYRPRNGETQVDFLGTPLLPKGDGHATIKGEKGYITVDAHFGHLEPPAKFGREYLTYVLWAITPEGRATNLGEVQYDDSDAKIKVTTELQAFALVLTAEPYFAVSQPSDAVVMENVFRPEKFASLKDGTQGRPDIVDAKYELLKRGSYLMPAVAGQYKVKALEPGAPLDLGEARNAVELARLAGADRYASDSFAKAQTLLAEAESAREARKRGKEVQQPAREAAQTAEDARLIALQRQEEERQAQERAAAAERLRQEQQRAQLEQERAQQEALRRQQADAERLAAENARIAAERERQAADQAKADAEAARLAAERERQAADAARAAAEAQAQQARDVAAQAQVEKDALREQLRQQLSAILETRETARGLIVNLSDVLFDFNKATLRTGAREKLAKIAGIVQAHPGLNLSIEGHTDSIGSDEYNQRLSERRAESVQTYLNSQGVQKEIVGTSGFGESRPVASNGTAAGRQQNRRVELVVAGEAIGR